MWKYVPILLIAGAAIAEPPEPPKSPNPPLSRKAAKAMRFNQIEGLEPLARIKAYEEVLETEKDSSDIYFRIGNAFYDAAILDEAAEAYRKSLATGGEQKVAINLAYVLTEAKKRDEADDAYREAIARWPENAVLHAHYGDFLSEGSDPASAVRAAVNEYRRAIEIDPNCIEAHFGLGVIFADSEILGEAISEWEKVIAIHDRHRLASQARNNIKRIKDLRGR